MNEELLLLLNIQRFAGDGEGEIEANESGLEDVEEELNQLSEETGGYVGDVNGIIEEIVADEAMDEGAIESLTDATNYASDVANGLTEAIGGLGTFIASVISTFQESSQIMINEITEWGNSLRTIFADAKDGAMGTRDGEQIGKGEYSPEEYAEDIKSDLSGAVSGIKTISEGTRELAISTISAFKHTGQSFASLTGNSLVGSIKNLFDGITNPESSSAYNFFKGLKA